MPMYTERFNAAMQAYIEAENQQILQYLEGFGLVVVWVGLIGFTLWLLKRQ